MSWREDMCLIWAAVVPLTCLQLCRELEAIPEAERGPLYGVPFAVKDNIDVATYPTTAACEAFRYTPAQSAPAVQALEDAGDMHCSLTHPVPSAPATS